MSSSIVQVQANGQTYRFPGSMSDSEIMRHLNLNPNDYTYGSRQEGGTRHLTFVPRTGTKGAGTEYSYNNQIYRFEQSVTPEEARSLIAMNEPSVRNASFTATSLGGTFVLNTGTKGTL